MCLIISLFLFVISFELLTHNSIMMGLGSLLMGLFFITMMVRNVLHTLRERGKINAKECLKCSK
ncbi:MAG: hypothetical protein OEW60_07035 [Thiovulaceae bacterium]|nr:hypothetical protein [Sulfurimonadaceae bacterium]